MHRKRYLSLAMGMLLVVLAVGPAAAKTPNVSLVGCSANGGQTTVSAAAPFTMKASWGALTLKQQVRFLVSVEVVVQIDGVPIRAAYKYWQGPVDGGDIWVETWRYRHDSLAVGEMITVTSERTFDHPVYDGTDRLRAGTVMQFTCTITGA